MVHARLIPEREILKFRLDINQFELPNRRKSTTAWAKLS